MLGTLQTLTFSGERAFGTYTRGPHVKQDNKFKLIRDHKRFIIDSCISCTTFVMFCEIMFVLTGRKLTRLFHTVGKKPAAYMVGHADDAASEGRCGIPLRKYFRKPF